MDRMRDGPILCVKARLHVPSPSPSSCLSLCQWKWAVFIHTMINNLTETVRVNEPLFIDTMLNNNGPFF